MATSTIAPAGLTHAELLSALAEEHVVPHVRRYFSPARRESVDSPLWTGSRFEFLAGGGNRPEVADTITADDLVAVTLLGVRVPGDVALALLEGALGREVSRHLATVPAEATITDADAATQLAVGGPLDQAWTLLKAPTGMGWVTTSKLLARKRPALVPVYDEVVRCVIGAPKGAWNWFVGQFAQPEGELAARLLQLKDEADVPDGVSVLRVLDVALWTSHHEAHRAGDCVDPAR